MNKNNTAGIGFEGLLQIAFIVLKLCGVIHWSWGWVLAPTWVPIGILLISLVVFLGYQKIKEYRAGK